MFVPAQLVILALSSIVSADPVPYCPRKGAQAQCTDHTDGSSGFDVKTAASKFTNYSSSAFAAHDLTSTPTSRDPRFVATTYRSNPSSTVATKGYLGTDSGYMATVSKWRAAGGYPALTRSTQLEANALKTANDGNGEMHHELNAGSRAQVLGPGSVGDFEKVYVGGWLCEITTLPGLNGICGTMTAGWKHSGGVTGHAEALTSSSYKNIGCAWAKGIWACDLS